ncbi:unnamed protein product [Lupinus luteus]|uniref:Uncharacterized protein n=1 Tax=Lupinus luteus TaxID=3873 RepID=A0AAV1W8Z8_LUPLU
MATTTSSNCSSFFSLRSSNPVESRGRNPSSLSHGSSGCGTGKLDGVAMWLINGVTMVFFASLNHCSCIRIATEDDGDAEDANDLPLMLNDGNLRVGGGATGRRRKGKGKKSGAMLVDEE